MIFIDGDFNSNMGTCKHHCYPTCHPEQIGPERVYGCLHKAWWMNRCGDFVPIVECGGSPEKCDMKDQRFKKMVGTYKQGKSNSLNHALKKVERLQKEIEEINQLTQIKNK